jgi:zinc protease
LMNQIETNRIDPSSYISVFDYREELGFSQVVPNLEQYAVLSKITMEDVAAFHRDRVSGKPYTMSVVADRKLITKDDLGRYGKVVELGIDEIFGF